MPEKWTATVVSHTHWDRAWYCTFQEFRVRLVRLVDRLIDLLENDPRFPVFMLDGQLSMIEDYLEARPERREKIRGLVRAGRLTTGPWYVLPDEFLVSPESIIRNLGLGLRQAEELGGGARVGYVPDGFGHIAQLPQILNGFGIKSAFFWRGMGEEGDSLGTDFEWVAPDGSRVAAVLMPWGYHNLANVGYAIRWGDTSQMEFDWDLAMAQVGHAIEALKPMSRTGALLLMNGIDHAEAEPRIPELIERASQHLPDIAISAGTLQQHIDRVRASGVTLPEFTGEFRWGRYSEVLQGVYSTRIHLKQLNHQGETLLEKYAEPLDALAWMAGAQPISGSVDLLQTAWHWLLQNHPHDDIYGSGIDPVHEEMLYRFSQARQIAEMLVRDNLRLLARQADCSRASGMPVIVFNPLARERREVAIGALDFDFDDPAADNFRLFDDTGHPLPCQVLDSREEVWMETLKPNRKRRVTVAFPATAPGCGYTIVFARRAEDASTKSGAAVAEVPADGTLAVSRRGAENALVAFTIESDGSLTVRDKTTGATYEGLNVFSDVEDAGDEYSSSPCAHSETLTTRGLRARVRCLESGSLRARFRVDLSFPIPRGLNPDRKRRQKARVELSLSSEIDLLDGSPTIRIRTSVENRAEDHKLSVLFPTDLVPHDAMVDAAFAVVARPVDLPHPKGWVEDPTPLMHQRSFTDLSDGTRGLAVLNKGLPSVEVMRRDPGTAISLTLLRCVGWLSRDDLSTRRVAAGPLVQTPGAQMKGVHVFEYAIHPHAGDWRGVIAAACAYTSPLLVARADTHEGMELREMPFIGVDLEYARKTITPIPWPRQGPHPSTRSFLRLSPGSLVLSAVKRTASGNGLVVRFYNPEHAAIPAAIESDLPISGAWELTLEEKRKAELPLTSPHSFGVVVGACGIVTCEIAPERRPHHA
ncbi:MAG: glycoside hydrolase family 38 C-terminal domain-containing protein [Spirochaetia bacterium]